MKNLKNWQGIAAVIGIDFGDSGKGRLIDDLSPNADIIARYGGGRNTGHTVVNEKGKFAMHIIPSGIFNSNAVCLVGRGVAVSCESVSSELQSLKDAKVSYKNLVIDENASLTMPWHVLRDGIRENLRKAKIGTTKSGIGPTYADRTERVGLRVKDLVSPDFKDKLFEEIKIQNSFFNLKLNALKIFKDYKKYANLLKPFVGRTIPIIKKAQKEKKNILFEGAQGYFLDIDSGTYPFVTSSNPGIVGIWRSFDIHPSDINHVIGITKSYITRVGEGPLPTEVSGKIKNYLVEKGHEFGTTTGRMRRPGWFDLPLMKSAADSNRLNGLAITKLDVLSGLPEIKIAVIYKKGNGDYYSGDAEYLAKSNLVYKTLPGWKEDITKIRRFSNLPKNAQNYVKFIEKHTDVPVKFISVGPGRGEVIYV